MACNVTLNGIVKDCDGAVGGIRAAWIASADAVTVKVEDDLISEVDGGVFKKFEFRKNTGNFTTTINNDDASGTTYYSTDIVLQFTRQETDKRIEIAALAVGDVVVVVKDANNRYWYFGYDEPVTLSAGTAESGTAKADFNGYNITLSDESTVMPYEISAAFAATKFI
ncbi:MAG: hypothetical protein LUG98_09985 [Tannerellaceae bacterium]|nr:hypothetical protein [Tannerellaceae bacterium]